MMMLLKKQKPDASVVDLQQKNAWSRSEEFIGQTVEVLVESFKKKPKNFQEEILKT
jgi:tRNA A37 methylthiotransferase MiaB